MKNKQHAATLDEQDILADYKAKFYLPDGVIYLDGNSLGPMPLAAKKRSQDVVESQWATSLIKSWNEHNWISLPQTVGEKIAPLVGAARGQVICCDSVSVNLYKVLKAALALRPERTVIASTQSNFPTDLYIAEGVLEDKRGALEFLDEDSVVSQLHEGIAVLMLTEVNFRTGAKLDMRTITREAHRLGILVVWDLAHSTGAFEVNLDACDADFAVGCTYKYLNGGPGNHGSIFIHSNHQRVKIIIISLCLFS